jgi:hypothetical protein
METLYNFIENQQISKRIYSCDIESLDIGIQFDIGIYQRHTLMLCLNEKF